MFYQLLFLATAVATAPKCAVLLNGDNDTCVHRQAIVWVQAAEEEATRFFHTVNGGVLEGDCTSSRQPQRVEALNASLDSLLCIDRFDVPKAKCHMKRCNFGAHPELGNSDCDDNDEDRPVSSRSNKHNNDDDDDAASTAAKGGKNSDGKNAACRTIESWSKIATSKLGSALDYLEQGNDTDAISYACVSDFLFMHIDKWLVDTTPNPNTALPFISDSARRIHRYRSLNSASRTGVLPDLNLTVVIRAIQSVRECKRKQTPRGVSLPSNATLLVPGDDLNTNDTVFQSAVSSVVVLATAAPNVNLSITPTIQLASAITGTVPSFSGTLEQTDPTNRCVRINAATNLQPFDTSRRLPGINSGDWAVVRYNHRQRTYRSLSPNSACPAPVLLNDPKNNKNTWSATQILMQYGPAPQQPSAFSTAIEASIFGRSATDEQCTDSMVPFFIDTFPGNNTVTPNLTALGTLLFSTKFLQPPAGIPLTLAPGESRCVGGSYTGRLCTMETECGTGLSCRRKPLMPREFAYCYDGQTWDEDKPCVYADADDECPNGYCFGAVSGHDGSAYPMLDWFNANECGRNTDDPVCQQPSVKNWFQHPSALVFSDIDK